MRNEIVRYHRWEDQQASLLGKLMIRKGLKMYGFNDECLELIEYNKYGKPYISGKINFNISHSGDYVICAISENIKLGIDIEKITRIDFNHFKSQFLAQEWNGIINSKNQLRQFYKYWTQKEAVIKAAEKGLSISLRSFFIRDCVATLRQEVWYLSDINIDSKEYCCSLAVDRKIRHIDVYLKKVYFNN
uniref:4'-phosphopantetheinyl transferase family protein n=1 Tax=Croceitalea sp. MTPC5 TaxID=3056565 RepID=UPI0030CAB2EB